MNTTTSLFENLVHHYQKVNAIVVEFYSNFFKVQNTNNFLKLLQTGATQLNWDRVSIMFAFNHFTKKKTEKLN